MRRAAARRVSWGLTFDMSGGAKGAKRPLGRPLDGGVRRLVFHVAEPPIDDELDLHSILSCGLAILRHVFKHEFRMVPRNEVNAKVRSLASCVRSSLQKLAVEDVAQIVA